MIIDSVRLPIDIERGVVGGPQFNTMVLRTDGGVTSTNQAWTYPLYTGNVGYGVQTKENLNEVINFFYARRGRLRGFLFRDWSDYLLTPDEVIGTGDGVEHNFTITKTYADSVLPFTRIITRPVQSSLVVKDNGAVVSAGAYSVLSSGLLHFVTAPLAAHVITISSGEFDIPVMFGMDKLDISMLIWSVGSIPTIPIQEVRE